MKQTLIFATSLLFVGLLLFYMMSNNSSPLTLNIGQAKHDSQKPREFTELDEKITELSTRIEHEITERKKLEQQIKALKIALIEKESNSDNTATVIISDNETIPSIPARLTDRNTSPGISSDEALTLLGLTDTDIEQIKQRVADDEMKLIRLRNQAMREEWYGSKRWFEESAEIDEDVNIYREELGDDKYDRYLFQTGQRNRVVIQSIIPGSPGNEHELKEGDIILNYADNRIFRWNDLTSATSTGTPEEIVKMEILRDTEVLEIYIPRGPIGIRLTGTLINPDD